MADYNSETPLAPMVHEWIEVLKAADKIKRAQWTEDAEDCLRFFDGPHDFMYGSDYMAKGRALMWGGEKDLPQPSFRMTVNKAAEVVQLFGPYLYHQNPYRQITPRPIHDPMGGEPPQPPPPEQQQNPQAMLQYMMAQQAFQQRQQAIGQMRTQRDVTGLLLGEYLNYTPNELLLNQEFRDTIDETLITGLGVLLTEPYKPHGSPYLMCRTRHISAFDLLLDCDVRKYREGKWAAIRHVKPRYEVERKFGLEPGSLRGRMESATMQGSMNALSDSDYWRARGDSNDLITYWEVFSRMGAGGRLRTLLRGQVNETDEVVKFFEKFGDNVYLVIAEDVPYPLNLPPEAIAKESADDWFYRLQWPTPFWADPADPWPFTLLAFHWRPRNLWPMSHLKPAMGELMFLNWACSFMADKIKNTSRDFIAILKEAEDEIVDTITGGSDLSIIRIKGTVHKTINDVVQFLQHPEFNGSLGDVISYMERNVEMRLGTNELMYGSSKHQFRSSAEAQIKGEQIQMRPQDMATRVEEAATAISRKEAICARYHMRSTDVSPVVGPFASPLWDQYVRETDIYQIVHEFDYRIEAGSIRKPNKDRDMANAQEASRVWGPVMANFAAATGDWTPLSNLAQFWAKAYDLPPEKFTFQPPPPTPEQQAIQQRQQEAQTAQLEADVQKTQAETQKVAAEAAGAGGEGELRMQEAMLDSQIKQSEAAADMQVKQMEAGLDAQLEQQRLAAEMQAERERLEFEMQAEGVKLGFDVARHQQEIRQDEQVHRQEMAQRSDESQQQLATAKQSAQVQIDTKKKLGAAQAKAVARRRTQDGGGGGSKGK